MNMTNEEKAELSANSAMISRQSNLYHTNVYNVKRYCFNHSDLVKQFLAGAEWKEQQIIEKAVKWLKANARYYVYGNKQTIKNRNNNKKCNTYMETSINNKCRAFTSLEQSRKLAEILPLESADMWWTALNWQETEYYVEVKQDGINQPKKAIPCWSLAALLDILQKVAYSIDEDADVVLDSYKTVEWHLGINNSDLRLITEPNPVDACYEMILKLNELNLL